MKCQGLEDGQWACSQKLIFHSLSWNCLIDFCSFFYTPVWFEIVSWDVKNRPESSRVMVLKSQQLKRPQTSSNVAAHQIHLSASTTDKATAQVSIGTLCELPAQTSPIVFQCYYYFLQNGIVITHLPLAPWQLHTWQPQSFLIHVDIPWTVSKLYIMLKIMRNHSFGGCCQEFWLNWASCVLEQMADLSKGAACSMFAEQWWGRQTYHSLLLRLGHNRPGDCLPDSCFQLWGLRSPDVSHLWSESCLITVRHATLEPAWGGFTEWKRTVPSSWAVSPAC